MLWATRRIKAYLQSIGSHVFFGLKKLLHGYITLFGGIRSFQSIIFDYFGPKTTTFLHSSSSCRKPTKCKLSTPEIIRWKPRKSFARAIQIASAARFFWCCKITLRWYRMKKTFLCLYNDYTPCSLEEIKWNKVERERHEQANEPTTDRPTEQPNETKTKRVDETPNG